MALRHKLFTKIEGKRACPAPKPNRFTQRGKALVASQRSSSSGDIRRDVRAVLDKIGGLKKVVKKGDSVLIKPNLVFAKPPPCSTDPALLIAVVKECFRAGASKVTVGERSAYWENTRHNAEHLGLIEPIQQSGADMVFLDEGLYYTVQLPKQCTHLREVAITEENWKHDRHIALPCLKTHRLARFTMSLKLNIGMIHGREMPSIMFLGNLEAKIAELNRAIWPDLILLDGRSCFVTSGPDKGEVEHPKRLFASGDRCAIDAIGAELLRSYRKPPQNKMDQEDPFQYTQIKTAAKLGLGVGAMEKVKLV